MYSGVVLGINLVLIINESDSIRIWVILRFGLPIILDYDLVKPEEYVNYPLIPMFLHPAEWFYTVRI